MAFQQIVQVTEGATVFESRVAFGLPGAYTDADVQVVAQAIVQGYISLYGTQVRDGGLFQVDMTRQIVPPAPVT